MTSIFILGRIRLYREGLARVLSQSGALDVLGTHAVDAGSELKVRAVRPNVVLLDMGAPEAHAVARRLHQLEPNLSVISVGIQNCEAERLRCAEIGIVACVTDDAPVSELLSAIERAARGEAVYSPTMARDLVHKLAALTRERQAEPAHAPLTRREREIALLLAHELSNKEIANRLGIEVATVKNHVHSVLEKLSVRRRSEITRAVASHLPPPTSPRVESDSARVAGK